MVDDGYGGVHVYGKYDDGGGNVDVHEDVDVNDYEKLELVNDGHYAKVCKSVAGPSAGRHDMQCHGACHK